MEQHELPLYLTYLRQYEISQREKRSHTKSLAFLEKRNHEKSREPQRRMRT